MLAHREPIRPLAVRAALLAVASLLIPITSILAGCGAEADRFALPLVYPAAKAVPDEVAATPVEALRMADVTGDGVPDLLLLGADGALHLLHGDGAGAFVDTASAPAQPPIPVDGVELLELGGAGPRELLLLGGPQAGGTSAAPVAEARLSEANPTTPFPGGGSLGFLMTRESGGSSEGLLRFDLDQAVPAAARVLEATCELFFFGPAPSQLPAPVPLGLFANLEGFDPLTVTFQSWYAAAQPTLGVPEDLLLVDGAQHQSYLGFDVTAVVAAWLEGVLPNHGLNLRREPPLAGDDLVILSSTSPLASAPPRLELRWEEAENLLLLNDGAGGFQGATAPLPPRTSFRRSAVAAALDLGSGGPHDLFLAGEGQAEVLRNTTPPGGPVTLEAVGLVDLRAAGSGLTALRRPAEPPVVTAVVAIDLDGDGWDDLLLGTTEGLRLLRNAGDYQLTDVSASRLPLLDPSAVACLVVLEAPAGRRPSVLVGYRDRAAQLLRVEADGRLVEAKGALPAPPVYATDAVAVDLDRDGHLDVITVHPTEGMRLLLGTSRGGLVEATDLLGAQLPASPRAIAASARSGGGRLNLVIGGDEGVMVLRGR